MEALLYQLRKRNRKSGPTPYLDMLLAAFQQENKARIGKVVLDVFMHLCYHPDSIFDNSIVFRRVPK
jgi:hypothetical protein